MSFTRFDFYLRQQETSQKLAKEAQFIRLKEIKKNVEN